MSQLVSQLTSQLNSSSASPLITCCSVSSIQFVWEATGTPTYSLGSKNHCITKPACLCRSIACTERNCILTILLWTVLSCTSNIILWMWLLSDGYGVPIIPLIKAQSYDMTRSTFSPSHWAEQSADRKHPYALYQSHWSHSGMQWGMKAQARGGEEGGEEGENGQRDRRTVNMPFVTER